MKPQIAAAFLLVVCTAGFDLAFTQNTSQPQDSESDPEISLALVESRLKEIEANPNLDETVKSSLVRGYQEALDLLKQADNFRTLEREYRAAFQDDPEETGRLLSEVRALQEADPSKALPKGLDDRATTADLSNEVTGEQAVLASLESELRDLTQQLSVLRTRPAQITKRRVAGQSELADVLADLNSAEAAAAADRSSLTKRAELDRLKSLREKLAAEMAMLEQEDLSDEIRITKTEAARDLAEVRIQTTELRIEAVRELADSILSDHVRKAKEVVERIRRQRPDAPSALDAMVEEIGLLVAETQKVTDSVESVEDRLHERKTEQRQLEESFNDAKRQVELGVLEGTLAHGFLEQLIALPSHRTGRTRKDETKSELVQAQRGLYELDRKIRFDAQGPKSKERTGGPARVVDIDWSVAEFENLEKVRDSLRADLKGSYRRWIRSLGNLDLMNRQIIATSREFRNFSYEKLFFIRSAQPISLHTVASIPEGLAYCFGLNRVGELFRRLETMSLSTWALIAGVFSALILPRRRFRAWLRESGRKTRQISEDHYSHTIVALVSTILLAAPGSLVLGLLGWGLTKQPDASDWSYGLGLSLFPAAWFLFKVMFVMILCQKEGLGDAHFRWNPEILQRVRLLSGWLLLIYLPVMITVILIMAEPEIAYLSGLGRFTGMAGALGIGAVGALIMHPAKGIAASVHGDLPRSLFGRLRHFWIVLILVFTLLITILFVAGYVFTGVLLIEQIEMSLTAGLAAFVVYGLGLRWFAIKERQLELIEAMEAREADREPVRSGQEDENTERADEDALVPETHEEESMDLAKVAEQTRNLLEFLVGAGLLVGLWYIWTKIAPVMNELDQFNAFGDFTFADFAVAVITIAVTISAARNVPGLLEVVALRRLDLDAGSRNSITTLAKYAIIAIGATLLFRTLGVDWSKLGWIAAALSVGIGFGLQEVVANFISGIILLFERPVRVGDVVTVDGVDGTVSRIQIRATTITNWDRKELIIPNKNFVTGSVLNWTLSSPVVRIVIDVGVAYGSDTKKAMQILVDVAHDHPGILADPTPLATFEAFDADALRMLLCCHIPNMDERVVTNSELHSEIDRRFKEANIEIAFPQRDLHLRSVDPGIQFGDHEEKE